MQNMLTYIQKKLERASMSPDLFKTELNQSFKILMVSEVDQLAAWYVSFTKDKPQLKI